METVKNVAKNLWRLIRRSFRKYRIIYIAAGVALILLISLLVSCHKHTPGPEATCTEPQVCTECGEVIHAPLGHTPGPEATCSEPQVCTVCGAVLNPALQHTLTAATCTEGSVCTVCGYQASPALGHEVGEDGVCTVCKQQICQPGCQYVKPGADSKSSDDAGSVLAETATGHYNNNITAYYSSYTLVCGDYGLEYVEPSSGGSSDYASIISEFAAKYPNQTVYSIIAPKAAAFLSPAGFDDLHDPIANYIKNTYSKMSGVKTVDVMGKLESHKDEYIFYRTDINWTSLGAYYATAAFLAEKGVNPLPLNSYDTVIQTGYAGALYYFSNEDGNLKSNLDYTVLRYPQTGYTLQYTNDLENWANGKAINGEAFGYSYVFIEGDQPCEVIRTDNHNGKCIMVIKDACGNAMIPYLIDHYETIVVQDFRCKLKATEKLVNDYGVNDILVAVDFQSSLDYQDTLKALLMS